MTDKPLSREEILKKNHAKRIMNWEDIFKQSPSIIDSAHESMSEYAEQEAIYFDVWKFNKGWRGVWVDVKFCYRLKHEFKSPQDLYKLYTDSKTEK